MSDQGVAVGQLRAFVERVLRTKEEQDARRPYPVTPLRTGIIEV